MPKPRFWPRPGCWPKPGGVGAGERPKPGGVGAGAAEARVSRGWGAAGAGGSRGWGAAEAEVRFRASVAMLSDLKIRPRGLPPTSEPNWGNGPHSLVGWWASQEYREAIRGPGRQKQQDEVAGCGAAWAATAPTPGRNEAGPRLAQARCQDGASPNAEKLRRPLHTATTPRVPIARTP